MTNRDLSGVYSAIHVNAEPVATIGDAIAVGRVAMEIIGEVRQDNTRSLGSYCLNLTPECQRNIGCFFLGSGYSSALFGGVTLITMGKPAIVLGGIGLACGTCCCATAGGCYGSTHNTD